VQVDGVRVVGDVDQLPAETEAREERGQKKKKKIISGEHSERTAIPIAAAAESNQRQRAAVSDDHGAGAGTEISVHADRDPAAGWQPLLSLRAAVSDGVGAETEI
jgi:hypothetical protein